MAIAIATSPPLVSSVSTSATTASFNAPADSLLVAMVMAFSGAAQPSVSGGGLTWTRRVRQNTAGSATYAEIWTAPCPAGATGITVTAAGNDVNFPSMALKVDVVTGANLASPIGNTGTGTSATNASSPTVYTSSQAGSRGFLAAAEIGTGGAPSSTDDESPFVDANGFAGMAARKAANTASSGTGVTFNLDASGTTGGDWRWAAVEIRPGSIDATVSAATVTAAGEVPAAAVRTGQTAHPATVTAAAEVPPPGVHAGQTAHPAAVTAAGEVPKPNVVAGSASLVKPSAVTAGAQVPAPSITAVQNRTLSPPSVTAGAEVPAPTVTATRLATITPAAVEAAGEVPSAGVTVPTLPGDNLTDIGQVELNGVVWGMGTRYRIREITGWESLPQIDDLSEEEPGRHGAYAGGSLAQRRIVTVALQLDSISDPTQVDDLLRQLRYDTRVLRDNSLWTFVVRGYSQTLLAYGKVTDRTGVMGDAYSVGAPEPVITITCPDPRRYELDQQSQVVAANASAPTQFINSGDVYTNPILRFAGPATNPMIINETLDRILAFDVTLMAGQLLVVDTNRGKAMLGSTDYGSKVADTISVPIKEWFLDVGANAISYETDAGGAAGVEVLWRSAFL